MLIQDRARRGGQKKKCTGRTGHGTGPKVLALVQFTGTGQIYENFEYRMVPVLVLTYYE